MAQNVILQSKISEGSYRSTVLLSLALHVLVLVAIVIISNLHPWGPVVTPGTGPGGGSGGDMIPVSLVDNLDGGAGNYYPSPKPQPPAVELPKPAEPKETAVPLPDLTKKPSKETKPKKEGKKPREQKEEPPKKLAKVPSNYIPRPAGPGTGKGTGTPGGVGHGIGEGYGIKIGPGSGDGMGDSWYARQVQQRISSNWLRSLIGDVRGNYEVTISFYVRDNGAIVGISIEKPSGVRSLDDSALRAIKISDPLAPLPFELRGKAVKFVAQFPYPPK